jgi:transcriptional regulator with XRE-family HTH domain
MTQTIAERLKILRTRRHLSQNDLATKAKVDKQTIYRIEAERQTAIRPGTVKKLAAALGVSPEVLTCQEPLPELGVGRAQPSNDEDYSINVSVDGVIRNAFSLVHMRYRVPIARIVELAPFLFVLAAEASLERRKAKLTELQEAFDQAGSLLSNFPYLPSSLCPPGSGASELRAEARSISTRDIWGDGLPDNIYAGSDTIEPDYSESTHNPFAVYLKEVAPLDAGVASIHGFDRSSSEFNVCHEDALKLADGDADLATSIVDGDVILHKMPRELLNDHAVNARTAWLRETRDARRAAIHEMLKDLLEGTVP